MRGARRSLLAAFALLLAAPRSGFAQERGAVALAESVRGLGNTVRVLMIGAHPDDEDTQLITWLARGRRVETGYLSLTRGDGGQNLIGNELGPALGVVRTEELLAARRLDGGRQFFTRAYDFGFSKNAEETWTHWAHDSLLKDMVTIVRAYRPHVIIAVFSGTPRDGHGHHQASGILAREVFDAAADTVRFPRSESGSLAPWAPLKFYRAQRFNPADATVAMNVGAYNPLLGRSYAEIAGESRSQHLSQAFGTIQPKGARLDYVRLEASRVGAPSAPEGDILAGIDTAWARFAGVAMPGAARAALDSLPGALDAVNASLSLRHPGQSTAPLARYLQLATAARDSLMRPGFSNDPRSRDESLCRAWGVALCADPVKGDLVTTLDRAIRLASSALLESAGIAVEALAPREVVATGDTLPIALEVFNRGGEVVQLLGTGATQTQVNLQPAPVTILPDSSARTTLPFVPSRMVRPTMPWWLERDRNGDMFRLQAERASSSVPLLNLVVGEDRIPAMTARATVRIAGVPVEAEAPVVHRYADPARGEIRRPIAVTLPVTALLERSVEYLPANRPVSRRITVHLQSGSTSPRVVGLGYLLPDGMRLDSAPPKVTVPPMGQLAVPVRVRSRLSPGQYVFNATATDSTSGIATSNGYVMIDYPHIRPQRFYRPAAVLLSAVDVTVPAALNVAYVAGVSDDVAPMLQQLGVRVTVLDAAQLATADLSRFTTLVIGPRAYQASDALAALAPKVIAFARAGGTVVMQYGQQEMQRPGFLPYPVTIAPRTADRVTDENAAVTVLDPAAKVLTWPNRIGDADWANWIQERAVYMPRTFDPAWKPVIEMHDPDEPPVQSGILVAKVGRGTFVYTTLAFFRQLPNGVPGPARLFVNLLAAGLPPQ
ncbi:MAG TPA: PIG-L family deacetylase [Gemmatimonadaceae bacterium]